MREKISPQARQVLGVLAEKRCHLTAEEILGRLEGSSTATVYRVLEQLTERGLICRVQTDGKRAVYEAHREPHMHFVCTHCGGIFDIALDLTRLAGEACAVCGHKMNRAEMTAYGLCAACAAEGTEETIEH